jgi:hypothetical protein
LCCIKNFKTIWGRKEGHKGLKKKIKGYEEEMNKEGISSYFLVAYFEG